MLTWLAEYEHVWGPLRLFQFLTFRALLAAGIALFSGLFLGPVFIRWLQNFKIRQSLRNQAEVGELASLHEKKRDTPTMGGLLIVGTVTLATLLCARPNVYVLTALFIFVSLAALGFADDFLKVREKNSKGVSGRKKLLVQAIVAVIALGALLMVPESSEKMREIWVPFLKDPVMVSAPLWFLLPFFFLILAGSSNALNLTDGVDGLAIGCTITVAFVYGIMAYAVGNVIISEYLLISYIPGTGELAVLCAALIGGGMAFLWYNAHPAEVFMGDTGSLALGGVIGGMAFMVHQPLTLIIVGGIFVMEAGSVMLQVFSFKTRRKRIFLMAPIHHHFELKGWFETKVVTRFWILSLIFAIAGLATLKLR
ncbi:MAG: phospho-N-acetylmuramoyl-pentapeptide-transferase [Opitutales bacterium]|nr:phospho-N-acetylmuramoyl-pentapeptide-transferase [Opitutales bacterium]